MNYLLANKEWIFSGIGVLIIGLAIKMLFKKNDSEQVAAPQSTKTSSNSNVSTNNNNVSITNNFPVSLNRTKVSEEPCMFDNRYKTHIRTLFVDDDTRFKVVDILKKAGWVYTKNKADIIDLDDPDVKEANVIFVDINGVGSHLFRDEGLGLAVALKKKYPLKKIVIYSAEHHGDRFHRAFRDVDECLSKNAEPYEFINLLETFSAKLSSI